MLRLFRALGLFWASGFNIDSSHVFAVIFSGFQVWFETLRAWGLEFKLDVGAWVSSSGGVWRVGTQGWMQFLEPCAAPAPPLQPAPSRASAGSFAGLDGPGFARFWFRGFGLITFMVDGRSRGALIRAVRQCALLCEPKPVWTSSFSLGLLPGFNDVRKPLLEGLGAESPVCLSWKAFGR